MKIIIAGNGKVGATLVRQLTAEGHDLTLIDTDKQVLEATVEEYDVMAVRGNCASMPVLQEAGVEEAELLIAVTNLDEVNLLCCMTAHGLNPKLHTIARIRNPEYTDQIYSMRNLFALSMTVNPEKQAAMEMERLIKFPGFLRRESFAKGKAEIVELRIDGKSKLKGVSLAEMYRIVKCRVLVCAVLRSGSAITPGGNFVLQEGDRVFVTAPTSNLAELLKNLGILTHRVRSVLIGGGGKISYYLAQLLEDDGIDVRILERDPQRCRELAAALPGTGVLLADACSRSQLEQLGLGKCDAFLSMTGTDEMNMITSLYAVSRQVPQVITKLGRVGSVSLADSLNLGSVICPRELSAALPKTGVLLADACSRSQLEQLGLGRCDAFLSMTGTDEMNMITSLYAVSRQVPQVITKLGRAGSVSLADSLNLGSVICPRELCSNEIVRYVRAMENQTGAAVSLHTIADGQAEAVEFLVDDTVENCGVPLKELKLRPGVLLATISHGQQVEIPGGDSVFRPGDTVVAVTTALGQLQSLGDIFA